MKESEKIPENNVSVKDNSNSNLTVSSAKDNRDKNLNSNTSKKNKGVAIAHKDVKKNNDTAMWLKVVKKAPCYLLKENLAKYRRRRASITPKPLWKRIWANYPLFRVAEEMNPLKASFWVIMNVFGNTYKKVFYVRRYEA